MGWLSQNLPTPLRDISFPLPPDTKGTVHFGPASHGSGSGLPGEPRAAAPADLAVG